MNVDLITCTHKDVKQKIAYDNLKDHLVAKRLFSRIKYAKIKEELDPEHLKQKGYDYVLRIEKATRYNLINGSVALLEKTKEQFEVALNMAESEEQKLKILEKILNMCTIITSYQKHNKSQLTFLF